MINKLVNKIKETRPLWRVGYKKHHKHENTVALTVVHGLVSVTLNLQADMVAACATGDLFDLLIFDYEYKIMVDVLGLDIEAKHVHQWLTAVMLPGLTVAQPEPLDRKKARAQGYTRYLNGRVYAKHDPDNKTVHIATNTPPPHANQEALPPELFHKYSNGINEFTAVYYKWPAFILDYNNELTGYDRYCFQGVPVVRACRGERTADHKTFKVYFIEDAPEVLEVMQ